ncbi:hypothetical protein TRIP_B360054 [uncultured Desulfatiglans sp.]|uniref:Uncharacterized protein n=1 Tax=Uncultured Desulfatiglans sp. TaxID=1748965 RepID=A0A653AD26_UNCDX|nr:hypothetical protein TRIP_B360054 [uncultured Desulfatiglans sp.]
MQISPQESVLYVLSKGSGLFAGLAPGFRILPGTKQECGGQGIGIDFATKTVESLASAGQDDAVRPGWRCSIPTV